MNKRFDGLLGVRGIGALGIIAYHTYILGGYSGYNGFLDRTVGNGGVFVQLFFMLSSFSMMCGYAEAMWNNKYSLEKFYFNRLKKLLPAFYVALVIHVVLDYAAGVKDTWYSIFGTGSLLYAFMPSHQESLVMAGWALGIEIIFYLLFPAFLVFVKNKKRVWITFVFSILLFISYNSYYGVEINQDYINIVRQLIFFVAGAVIYHYIDYIVKLNKRGKIIFAVVCLGIEVLCFAAWGHSYVNGHVLIIVSFTALIMNQVNNMDIVMNNRVMKWLGGISYQMYLFHMIVYRLVSYTGLQEQIARITDGKAKQYVIYYVCIVVLTVVFSYIFKHGYQYLNMMISKRKLHKD